MTSLRRRLLGGTAIGTAVVLLIAGVALYAMVRRSLFAEFDAALRGKAETLAGLIEQEGRRIDLEFSEADLAEFQPADRAEYFQLWRQDDRVVARSPSLSGRDLPQPEAANDRISLQTIILPDGRPGRIAALRFAARPDDETRTPESPQNLVFAIARDVLDVQSALVNLRWMLLLVGSLATLASVGILAWLVRVGLRPANRLAGEIAAIDEERLSSRLGLATTPMELQPIVGRLNELLARLEDAFAREKTMTADVAHELRTPLAGLRTTIEVALSRDRECGDYREALSLCLAICRQTQGIVENLLALARLDAGAEAIRREPIAVNELLTKSWRLFQATAESKKLRDDWQVESDLTVESDPEKLRLVVCNVLENAVHYANPGGSVAIQADQANGALHIRVSNTGCRISAEDVKHVFDRFWRGDVAREKDDVHSGLGLSLCKRLVESLGGTISAEADAEVFRITLRFSRPRQPVEAATPSHVEKVLTAPQKGQPATPCPAEQRGH